MSDVISVVQKEACVKRQQIMRRNLILIFNAFVFAGINHAAGVAGFLAYHFSGNPNQLMIQVPLAAAVSIVGVMLWLLYFGRLHRLELETDSIYVFLLTFPCGAVLFTGVHFLFTGYLTGIGNIIGGWVFAFGTNLTALALAAAIWRRRAARKT